MLRKAVTRVTNTRFQSSIVSPNYDLLKEKFSFEHTRETIKSSLASMDQTQNVCLNGWVDQKPKKIGKKLIFGTFRDVNGDKIQIVDSKGAMLKSLNIEDCIQIQGELKVKFAKNQGEPAEREFEINVRDLKILNKSNKTPSQLRDLLVTSETDSAAGNSIPQEYRYLQLRTNKYQTILKKRYLANKTVRSILDKHGFTEVETPLLFKSTPEGAREFLVPSRATAPADKEGGECKPLFYALPQSPQQYKQLLMASGVSRYFQVAKCFRDEDLRSDRQPEFTQIDMELSFANEKDVMGVVSDVVLGTWSTVSGQKLSTVDPKTHSIVANTDSVATLTYEEVMTNYGIDKPDLRFPSLKFVNLKEFGVKAFAHEKYPNFEVLVMRNAFNTSEELASWTKLLANPAGYNNRVPTMVAIETEHDAANWFEKMEMASFENPHLINKFLRLSKGDIILGCDREKDNLIFENPTPLGRTRQLITTSAAGCSKYMESDAPVAAWVVDFPMFTPNETCGKAGTSRVLYPEYDPSTYSATHHPFTMCKPAHLQTLLASESSRDEVLKCKSLHYDLVVNGVELGGGSVRVHDPEFQNYIFKHYLGVHDDALFKHLLNAFSMGCPPHAGFAIGFDRMCAMMMGLESIRDVIAFPKTVTGSDPVVGSPTTCTSSQLQEYHL